MDYYRTLGVPPTAKLEDITKAYRRLAMKYHPDRNPDEKNESLFRKVQEAYDVLSNHERRQAYDNSKLNALIEDTSAAAKAAWDRFINETLSEEK